MRARGWPALVVAAMLVLASRSEAKGPDRAREIEARRAFVAGEYTEAIELFAQLYAETLHPVYLRNLGRSHQKLGHAAQAIDFFRQYLNKGRSISDDEKTEIQGYIVEMEQLQKRQERETTLAKEQAERERVERESAARERAERESAEREQTRRARLGNDEDRPSAKPAVALGALPPPEHRHDAQIDLQVTPESPPVYTRWWFWSAVGLALAGGATALVLSRRTVEDKPPCPGACSTP